MIYIAVLLYLSYKIRKIQNLDINSEEARKAFHIPEAHIVTQLRFQAEELAKLRKWTDNVMRAWYIIYLIMYFMIYFMILIMILSGNNPSDEIDIDIIPVSMMILFSFIGNIINLTLINSIVFFRRRRKKRNQKKLAAYLIQNCMTMGYVPDDQWKNILPPEYVLCTYWTTFSHVVLSFAHSAQALYIDNEETTEWMKPVLEYLAKEGGADVEQLEQAGSEGLRYTHCQPDGLLVYQHMERHRKNDRDSDGNPLFFVQNIQRNALSDNEIANAKMRGNMAPLVGEALAFVNAHVNSLLKEEYYLHLYLASDSLRQQADSTMETEEFSLDDL